MNLKNDNFIHNILGWLIWDRDKNAKHGMFLKSEWPRRLLDLYIFYYYFLLFCNIVDFKVNRVIEKGLYFNLVQSFISFWFPFRKRSIVFLDELKLRYFTELRNWQDFRKQINHPNELLSNSEQGFYNKLRSVSNSFTPSVWFAEMPFKSYVIKSWRQRL